MQVFKDKELLGKLTERAMVIFAGIGAIWYTTPSIPRLSPLTYRTLAHPIARLNLVKDVNVLKEDKMISSAFSAFSSVEVSRRPS